MKWWELRLYLFTIVGLVGVLAYNVVQRVPPVQTLEFKLMTPFVIRGAELLTEASVYREKVCHTRVERTIIDSENYRWNLDADERAVFGPVGHDRIRTVVKIPAFINVGPAKYRRTLVYTCSPLNLIWPIIDQRPDVNFTVIDGGKQ
jgi:hypothetical protein